MTIKVCSEALGITECALAHPALITHIGVILHDMHAPCLRDIVLNQRAHVGQEMKKVDATNIDSFRNS